MTFQPSSLPEPSRFTVNANQPAKLGILADVSLNHDGTVTLLFNPATPRATTPVVVELSAPDAAALVASLSPHKAASE